MDTGERIRRAVEQERSERTPASGSGLGMAGECPVQPHPVNECNQPADIRAVPAGYVGDTVVGTAPSQFGRGEYRVSLADQAFKSVAYHREVADKQEQAGVFFSRHPEFEEFLRLFRLGAISLYE